METIITILACLISIIIFAVGSFFIVDIEPNIKNEYLRITVHMLLIVLLGLLIYAPLAIAQYFI